CAEDADGPEVFFRVVHLAKGERVRERQRRHVAEAVEEDECVERHEMRLPRRSKQEYCAEEVQQSQYLLRREELVGDKPDEERRDDGPDGCSAGGNTDLLTGEVQRLRKPGAEGDIPGSPDEVFEEHHR